MPTPKLLQKTETERLDRYELIGELASGGMATVFLARLAGVGGFQRFVAIKRLHPHLSKETEFVQMFLDEARLAASIHHPHVVPILEVGTSDAGYYVVMEYVEGDTLAGLMAREASQGKKIVAPVVMRLALDTLAGLHAAHELRDEDNNLVQLVHRDVSPQNILVGVDGSARITDFGVAKATSRLTSTREGTLKGKIAYMPPEQAKGGALDQRTDVFSLGVVLWEALAGRRLFKGESELETLNRLLFEPIPTLRQHDPEIPEAIEAVVMRALDRDPLQRYGTAAEFADSLEQASQGIFPIATVRDTATVVQQIIGHDIQQQRAAVRAWLAAEPSRQGSVEVDGLAPRLSRTGSGRPSALPGAPASVAIPPSAGVAAVPAPPAPASARSVAVPALNSTDVASLLSTDEPSTASHSQSTTGASAMSVAQVPAVPFSPASLNAPVDLPMTSRRSVVVPLALLALVGVVAAVMMMRTSTPDAPPVLPATSAPPAASPAQPATTTATTAAPTASGAPSSSAGVTSIDALPPERPATTGVVQRPAVGVGAGKKVDPKKPDDVKKPDEGKKPDAPTPPPTAQPDDGGYKNPYR